MANLLSNVTTAATSLSNLILVSPQANIGYQPQNKPTASGQTSAPPPTILFHYEGEQTVSLQSDITDHYVEDNTARNDQIALRPETITTQGFIGELNDVAPEALAPLKTVADKLTVIGAYTPTLTATALLAYNEAAFLYATGKNVADAAVSAWSSIRGTDQPNQTKQQIAFQQFYGYWKNRTLFTVQTPWAVFKDMAILSLRAVQDADTNVISDFEVTFKIMRFATTILTGGSGGLSLLSGRAAAQNFSLVDCGTSTPKPASFSLLSKVGT